MRTEDRWSSHETAVRRQFAYVLGALVSIRLDRLLHTLRKFDPSQPRDAVGRWIEVGAGSDLAGAPAVINRAVTGNTRVDDTTDFLAEKLSDAIVQAGEGRGPVYGTRVHSNFAEAVRAANWPGIEVERSFRLGELVPYALGGSVRTDVVLRDQFGEITAVWDVKTGGASIGRSRAAELRRQLGIGGDVPIIQLHHFLGSSIKARISGMIRGEHRRAG